MKAIREAIVNAIIHRDYSIMGSDIKIAIFDDMLEITSPGSLMPSVDPEMLKNTPSEVRNRVIAPIFKDCKLIEQWGSGFNKIYDDLAEYPEITMKINEPGLSFQMQFIKNNFVDELSESGLNGTLNGTLNGELELLLDKIVENPGINLNELINILKRPRDTLNKQIKKLIVLNFIERRGSRKTGGYWIVMKDEKK